MLASSVTLAGAVCSLCESLSTDFIERFVRLLRSQERLADVTAMRIMREVNSDAARDRLSKFLGEVRALDVNVGPQALALGIECALVTGQRRSAKQQVNVVWTGPLVTSVSLRRSAAVLLELIRSAQREIIIVSYAAFRIRDALAALEQRSSAGVKMHFILESQEDSHGRLSRDAAAAFDPWHGNPMAKFYIWPSEKRPLGALLHAKAVIVDGFVALITSANVTENAISSNIEIGVLIRGGDEPARIHEHIMELIAIGEFVEQES